VGPELGSVSVYISPILLNLSLVSPLYLPISRLDDLVDGRGERVEAGELLHGVRGRGRRGRGRGMLRVGGGLGLGLGVGLGLGAGAGARARARAGAGEG